MMLEEELKMPQFASEFQRAYLNIIFTGNWLESKMQQNLKTFGITTSQFNVLRILRGQKGNPMSAFAIQERMIHRTSNVTRIIEKLVEKKLVTREHCSTNRRRVDVAITEQGLELINSTEDITNRAYALIEKALSEDEARDIGVWMDKLRAEE